MSGHTTAPWCKGDLAQRNTAFITALRNEIGPGRVFATIYRGTDGLHHKRRPSRARHENHPVLQPGRVQNPCP
jgi:hypothetical protein